jgi:hypothetical protein
MYDYLYLVFVYFLALFGKIFVFSLSFGINLLLELDMLVCVISSTIEVILVMFVYLSWASIALKYNI